MDEITFRTARRDDLAAGAHVYVVADDELGHRLHGRSRRDPSPDGVDEQTAALADLDLLHQRTPDQVWVALHREAVIGVAAAAVHERHWHLVYLFVLPDFQSRAIGRELLTRAHAAGVAAGCDVFSLCASDDPRALTRYLALGLAPRPPLVVLRASAPIFPDDSWDDGLATQPLLADDLALLNTVGDLDKVVRGVRRTPDLQRWLSEGAIGVVLTRFDSGVPAGYFLVAAPGAHSNSGRIGPVVAMDEDRFGAVLTRALAAAGRLARPDSTWNVVVPGENRSAIAPLLAVGFRPRDLSNFLSSGPIGRWDRYVVHDEDLL